MFEVGSFSLGALLGILIGAFLGHILAIRRERSKFLWQAASDFREAFVVARKRIGAGENEVKVIADQYPVHEAARLKFVDYLSGRKANGFTEDWRNYKEWHAALCHRSDAQVLYESNDPTYLDKKGIRATTLIEALLNHACVYEQNLIVSSRVNIPQRIVIVFGSLILFLLAMNQDKYDGPSQLLTTGVLVAAATAGVYLAVGKNGRPPKSD